MRSCIFQNCLFILLVHLHITLFAFKNPKSGSSTISHTLSTKNEWPTYNKYVVAMKEKEWDETNIRKFINLIE